MLDENNNPNGVGADGGLESAGMICACQTDADGLFCQEWPGLFCGSMTEVTHELGFQLMQLMQLRPLLSHLALCGAS
jgi:hypothetical protein